MNLYYRSESSSSLTNEQIDSNFRTLDENRSITGSYTISGSLLPVNSSDSLGSNEQPWKEVYLSPDSIVFVSGGVSHSISFPLETYVYDPQYGTYSPEDIEYNLNEDWDAYRSLPTEDFPEFEGFNTYVDDIVITPPSGSDGSTGFPNGAINLGGWWNNTSILDNGGGFGVCHSRVLLGSEWLDRSRHYGTDGYNNSGSGFSGSIGHCQTFHEPRWAITGKSSVMFDSTYPRLWHFSAEAGWWGFARTTYAQTNGQSQVSNNNFGTQKNKVYYYNLLVSGSAYDIDPATGEQVLNDLEMPPYDDGDILVRMWNDNLPYWTYWGKLEYGEENVIHYNVSESNDPLGGSYPIYHQSSSNPGRIKLVNNYKSYEPTNKKWYSGFGSKVYEYAYDYNPVDPFISSSNLMLSLRMMAGTYVHNPTEANWWNTPPNHVQNSGFCLNKNSSWGGWGRRVQGSGQSHLYNKKQYGSKVPNGTNTYNRFYINTSSLAPTTNEAAGIDGVYPTGAYSSQMRWNEQDALPGSSYSVAYGYNALFLNHANGDCGITQAQGQTWTQIHPIIPLTTAHYPLSASYFWITSSYSNGAFTFRKPNDRVGSPSLYTLPFIATASLSPYTIYNANSTISSNRTIDLHGFDLTFSASNGETFSINASSSSEISITGLSSSNNQTLLSYNNSDGTLSILSTTSMSRAVQPYYYSTGSTTDNAEVTNDIKLELGLVYDYDNGITLDNSIYEVNTAGTYYINVNGTLGEDGEPLSNGLGWWKVALQVNGTTVAESTAKQSEVGEHYGGLDLMYVGNFSVSDTIQLVSDTSPSSATSSISNTTYRFSAEYLGA